MLDHFAIHVGDVERAVGSIGEGNRPEPEIARGEEFGFWFVLSALGFEGDTVRAKFFAVYQIAADISDESISLCFAPECGAAIDGDATGAGEVARGTSAAA